MTPATGTFTTMDTYQGSIFDPTSLHKYLYANANPVMNSDPSGYFTLSDLQASQSINSELEKDQDSSYIKMYKRLKDKLNKLNTILTLYDTTRQVIMILNDPEIPNWKIAEALGRGIVTALFINRMCQIKQIEPFVKLFVLGFGLYGQGESIIDAAQSGQWDLVFVRSAQLLIQVMSLPQTCFTGDTLVAAEDGQKRIDEIKVGDKVWAYDIYTGESELKEVLTVYVHEQTEILHLHTTVGDIDTTTNHPFYVIGRGWVAAGDLVDGDEIYLLDGTKAYVTDSELEKLAEPIKVYNLEVADFNTYFVGNEAVLVHNYSSNGDSSEDLTKVRHYTNRKGLEGIEESGTIIARDNNRVYVELANNKPLSPSEAEALYQLKPGRGRDYVEFEIPTVLLEQIKNPRYGRYEWTIKGNVEELINAFFKRRK